MAKDELLDSCCTEESDFDTVYEESGNIGLDMALTNGKGIPVGAYIILAAVKGSGKTTTCMDLARRILTRWKVSGDTSSKMLYIDMEKSTELARKMGLNEFAVSGSLLYRRGPCSITVLEKFSQAILDGKKPYCDIKYIIIDSITNLSCEKEMKAEVEKGDFGNAVAARNKWYKKYLGALEARGITIFGISQFRKKQQAQQYEDPGKAAVADGDLHYADIILKLSKSTGGNDSETKKVEVFNVSTGKVDKLGKQFKVTYTVYEDKNRFCKTAGVTSLMTYGRGCNNWYMLKQLLTGFDFMENKGSAAYPKWNFAPKLLAYIGQEEVADLDKNEMIEFLQQNISGIKNFLRAEDCYCNIKEQGDSDE